MITPTVLEEVVTFEAPGERVLSTVLGLDPERQIERDYRVVFRNLVRDMAAGLDDAARKALEPEAERVATYLSRVSPRGLGVVIYSCAPAGFWRVYYLPYTPEDGVWFTAKPRLRPLLDHIDEHERYAVVLVDRDSARVLIVTQRDIEDSWQLQSIIQGRHKQGGWSQANFQRSHDKAVDDHLKTVLSHLSEMDARHEFNRIVIGGPPEATARFQTFLPAALKRQLVGTFAIEMFATEPEILEKTREIARQAERDAEDAIVEQVISGAAAGGPAVTGLDATLQAVSDAQVGELVVSGTLSAAGAVCPGCGRLAAGVVGECPACGASTVGVDDVVEVAIERAIAAGGSVEIVHDDAEARLRQDSGGVGALLRYVPASTTA
jgi:peptide chain release factor subunit 1